MQTAAMARNDIRFYSALTVKQVRWLWKPYIPCGKVTIVQGDPGDGKTTLILNIASLISRGLPMPESDTGISCANVIYQSAEDSAEDTLKPRLISAGADCSKIAFIDESNDCLTLNSPRLESAIRETDAKLLVIDPLQAYLGDNSEMNRADGMRPAMKYLTAIAERTGCAIVLIGHMNKAGGSKGIYRGLGSIDITASARSVLLVGRMRNNPAIRILAQIKSSLAQEGSSIAFEINDDSSVRWIGEYDISAEELLAGEVARDEGGKLAEALSSLSSMLKSGTVVCGDIYARLHNAGISKRTVDSAKKQLGVRSVKKADGWYWSL